MKATNRANQIKQLKNWTLSILAGASLFNAVYVYADCDTSTSPTPVPTTFSGYQDITGCDILCNGTCHVSPVTPLKYCGGIPYGGSGGCQYSQIPVMGYSGTCGQPVLGDSRSCGCHNLSSTMTLQEVNTAGGC